MKTASLVLVLVASFITIFAGDETARILKSEQEGPNENGTYSYSFETDNGIKAQQEGQLKNLGEEETEALEVRGSYEYTAPDGTLISVSYIANEHGFQPTGTHITVPNNRVSSSASLEGRIAIDEDKQEPTQESEEETVATPAQESSTKAEVEADNAEASFLNPIYRNTFGGGFYRKRAQRRFF